MTGRGGGEVLVGRSAASGWMAPRVASSLTATAVRSLRAVRDP